jgi:hypothetical protein
MRHASENSGCDNVDRKSITVWWLGEGGWPLEPLLRSPAAREFAHANSILRAGFLTPLNPKGNPEKDDLLRVPFWE